MLLRKIAAKNTQIVEDIFMPDDTCISRCPDIPIIGQYLHIPYVSALLIDVVHESDC